LPSPVAPCATSRPSSALARVKKPAALANRGLGALPEDIADAIVKACEEIVEGRHHEHFVIDMLEGSGGTSINMNANEVIANRALQIIDAPLGDYRRIHPNDHVNMGQSTNDVVPTALKLAVFEKALAFLRALESLRASLAAKSVAFAEVLRLGRTCLQSAQPMTLGQAFGGYASAVARSREMTAAAADGLMVVPLGGTAIGTGLGAVPGYREAVLRQLAEATGWAIAGPGDLFDGLQNADAFARISSELRTAADILGKIASDLVILSSGPTGGIGEIVLPAVQAGSSIMPGKINPVLPIMMQQVAFAVTGNDLAVSMAVLQGQLEINHFEPVTASRLFDSLDLLTNGTRLFTERCMDGLAADRETSLRNLMESSALATVFVPKLGYAATTALVKESLRQKRSLSALAVEGGLLTEGEVVSALYRSAGMPAPGD
jgi:aspartate ammonia-lyase